MTDTHTAARAAISAGLNGHLARQRAARILDEQRAERAAIRAAKADALALETRSDAMTLAAGAPNLDALKAARRTQYREALAYPMSPAEALQAVIDAVRSCGLRADTDESAHETVGILMAKVIAKHGRNPLRCDMGRGWLRERAQRIYDRECFRRERATGLRASAALHAGWAAEDDESASDSGGPDAVWYAAAGMPAPELDPPLPAAEIAARLQLSPTQTDALTLTLESAQRVTVALTSAQRKAAADARARLRQRFPTPDALRYALRPLRAALAAVDACKRVAARRWQPSGPERPATVPGYVGNVIAARALTLPAPAARERPALALPDLGRYPLAVALRRGPRWQRVTIASDPAQPARGPRELVSGPRPTRAAAGMLAIGMLPAPEPTHPTDGWEAIERGAARRAERPTFNGWIWQVTTRP